MVRRSLVFVMLLVSAFQYSALAQKYEIGFFGGVSGYVGDLNQSNYFAFTDPVAGVIFRKNFDPRNTLKFTAAFGGVRGDDSKSDFYDQQRRNLRFRSSITEASLQYEFNFLNLNMLQRDENFTPYISTGIAYFGFDPKAENGERLMPLGTEGQRSSEFYNLSSWSVPIAGGIRYRMTDSWNLFGELGYRFTFTDYIDDVSGLYMDLNKTTSSLTKKYADRSLEPNTPGSQRGDLRKRDMYMFAVIGLTFSFVSSHCPTF